MAEDFMGEHYDRIEQVVHDEWLPIAPMGRVVADAVFRLPEGSDEAHVVNCVRRAFYAHRHRSWKAETEYPAGVTLSGPDEQTYTVAQAGRSGLEFEPQGVALKLKITKTENARTDSV